MMRTATTLVLAALALTALSAPAAAEPTPPPGTTCDDLRPTNGRVCHNLDPTCLFVSYGNGEGTLVYYDGC